MDTPQQFRTALNGFRREDVVRYLEYLNAKHNTEMNHMAQEADSLKSEVAALKAQLSEKKGSTEPSEDIQQLKAQLEAAEAEKKELEAVISDLKKEAEAAASEPAAPEMPQENLANQELEAYRRAERAERVANEKADLIYHRANAILDEASGKIDGASADLSQLAERINSQLQQMQYSINSSKTALKSAVDTMHALHVDKD